MEKVAKTLVMPVEEVKTTVDHNSDSTITEVPVCNNEAIENNTEVATTITEIITPSHNNNTNSTITEQTIPVPSYVIHTEPVDDPYAIGRLLRIDLWNNMTITDILELQNYILKQYQEGHTDSNGQRKVTYWKIINTKNSIPTITESNNSLEQNQNVTITEGSKWVTITNFNSIELDDRVLYNDYNSHWTNAKVIDKTSNNDYICVETDIDIYNLTITDIHRIKIMIA